MRIILIAFLLLISYRVNSLEVILDPYGHINYENILTISFEKELPYEVLEITIIDGVEFWINHSEDKYCYSQDSELCPPE